jgi:2-succinyl-5-enolpyruvyl-6-hydroxy-3-cyclohexene-1-carboxylate synthase
MLHDAIDERAAAFFALGQARATGRPSLLLCTSGSAGAHYLPAVIEAGEAGVPLVVLTADRPTELLYASANQTIDQRMLFEGYARHVVDLGTPDASPAALRGLRRIAAQAVALACGPVPGAVHLNARARKPLEPRPPESAAAHALAAFVRDLCATPVPRAAEGRLIAPDATIESLAQRCVRAQRGVIVAGPAPVAQAAVRGAVNGLAQVTGFPLFAEAASQLRYAGTRETRRIDAFDWLCQMPLADDAWRPDFVLQLGAPPTSGAWERLLERHPGIERAVIAPWGWPDPHATAAEVIHADVGTACGQLAEAVARLRKGAPPDAYARTLADADAKAQRAIESVLTAGGDALTEAAVARITTTALPAGAWLIPGNSLPIRTVDAYCPGPLADLRVLAQRGASGIDGLTAGAAGAASVATDPVVLLTGDVSFLHDLDGLMLGAAARVPLVVVVVNNGGGRIFEQLPVARSASAALMQHFTTPHAFDLEHAARLFGHAFERVRTRSAFGSAFAAACQRAGCTVIDAVVPPHGAAEDAARVLSALA